MANIKIKQYLELGFALDAFNPTIPLLTKSSGNSTSAIMAVDGADGVRLRVQGTGIRYDKDGHVIAGKITSVIFEVNVSGVFKKALDISGVSFDVAKALADPAGYDAFAAQGIDYDASAFKSVTGAEFYASKRADTLIGSAKNDLFYAGNGHDTLRGGGGNDALEGGAGNDKIYGDAGNDLLHGGSGADILAGGSGLDIADYYFARQAVTASLAAPSLNTGDAKDDTYSSIEGLSGSQYDDKLYGDERSNTIAGYSGHDIVKGAAGNDKLYGNVGNDKLYGDAGSDSLYGGEGKDYLYGGSGKDTFYFLRVEESTRAPENRDTIFDFSVAEGDIINLSGIDANTNRDGNQAFKFIGSTAFTNVAGQLRFNLLASDTYVYGDVDGDGVADFAIRLDDAVSLTKDNFGL